MPAVGFIRSEHTLGPGHMADVSAGRRSLRVVLLLAAAYLLIGIAFAAFSDWATTNAMHLMWTRLAWLVSGGSHCLRTLSSAELASHDSNARQHCCRPWRGRSGGG